MILIMLASLCGSFVLTAFASACRKLRRNDSLKQFQNVGKLFYYRYLHTLFFKNHELETLFFSIICAQSICRFSFSASTVLWLIFSDFQISFDLSLCILAVLLVIALGDLLPRLLGTKYPVRMIRLFSPIASLYLLIAFPFTYLFLKCFRRLAYVVYFDFIYETHSQAKRDLIEVIHNAELDAHLTSTDRKVIESIIKFHNRVTREIMVPRVDIYALSAHMTIKEAARLLDIEGFSRIPVYKNTIDNIIGILMYKDVIHKFLEYEQKRSDSSVLEVPIETIIKEVFYTPETKKISHLLQEFRAKQMHMAVVVDEYGGTEGIITIEDILEEIVGEIADEYDVEEEELFSPQPDGSWIVDARMNIGDIETELGLKIPQEGDYDTIGGYLFHRTGSIPPKGFMIHLNDCDIHVLQTDERSVDKVKIIPLSKGEEENE